MSNAPGRKSPDSFQGFTSPQFGVDLWRAQEPSEISGARALVGISELDSRLEVELAEHGRIKEFNIVLWRHAPDRTGCNWTALVERIRGTQKNTDVSWWAIVPSLRERFNLD